MTLGQLIDWQWSDYGDQHRQRHNLLIHIVAVPVFWIAAFEVLGALSLMLFGVPGTFRMLLWAGVLMAASLGAQAYGHSLERSPPHEAKTALEFAQRAAVEQFINFPRFVLSGSWFRNLRAAL